MQESGAGPRPPQIPGMEPGRDAYVKTNQEKAGETVMNPSDEYKLTDLDYLVGDHHLQMIKAALPYLNVTEQRAVSLFFFF